MAKSSSQRSAKPLYPVRVRGAPPTGQRKKVIRQSGGLETAGALPAGPTIFDSAKAQKAAHVIGNDAGPVQIRLADRFHKWPRSSTSGASGSEPEGRWCKSTRGCHLPMQGSQSGEEPPPVGNRMDPSLRRIGERDPWLPPSSCIRKLNRTSVPGPLRKRIVPLGGMGSMPSNFRHALFVAP